MGSPFEWPRCSHCGERMADVAAHYNCAEFAAGLERILDRHDAAQLSLALSQLGAQLVVAAALTRAYQAGNERGRVDAVLRGQNHHWRPGCGKPL